MRTISPFLVIDDNTTQCKEELDQVKEVKYNPNIRRALMKLNQLIPHIMSKINIINSSKNILTNAFDNCIPSLSIPPLFDGRNFSYWKSITLGGEAYDPR
jgi:esterase/lipase